MWDSVFYFVMVPMVYLAVAWALFGIVWRVISILRAPPHPHTLAIFPRSGAPGAAAILDALTMPQVRRNKPLFWVFLMLFHAALIVLVVAHVDLIEGVNVMPADSPHMIGWGAVGASLTIAVLYFLFRRFRSPLREISVPADFLMLFLLFLIFITGDVISWGNSWSPDGFVITKQDFGQYFRNLVTLDFRNPSEILYGSHYVVVVVHVLL
ncbi:MAG TPA: respiratory nitrate reductase subunit gamma, partial [Polyangia bacterium]|nr:respiratory nitrate reductase subunit gamma [Polyangia bacterium]